MAAVKDSGTPDIQDLVLRGIHTDALGKGFLEMFWLSGPRNKLEAENLQYCLHNPYIAPIFNFLFFAFSFTLFGPSICILSILATIILVVLVTLR